MHYVYLLQLNNGNIYTGSTGDLKKRVAQHMNGKVISTRYKRPLQLIHYEAYIVTSDAKRRESYLKTTEGKNF